MITSPPGALRLPIVVLTTGATLLTGCRAAPSPADDGGAGAPLAIQPLASPAGDGSGEPNLAVGPDGAVWLSWLEPTAEDRHALRLARWDGAGWDSARTVIDRPDLFVNWADFPSVLQLDDGTLAAHWLEKSGEGTYAYDVRIALSADGGETWSGDVIPHRDGVEAEHGFASLFPADGGLGAVWLDGRETIHGDPMTLRFTTIGTDGRAAPETLLDRSVCDCCQTGVAMTAEGPIVVYRDRTEEEVRDISLTRRADGGWTEPQTVHDDGWVIAGCPVNGPSIDAAGRRVAVAWFTGAAEDEPAEGESRREAVRRMGENGRVLLAFSEDAGVTFSAPVRVDHGAAMGRADVVLLDDGSALVAWLERTDGRAEVRIRRVGADGLPGASMPLAGTAAERSSGFPRMVRSGDRIVFAWTEPGPTQTVRTAVGRLTDAAAPTVASATEAHGR